MKIHSNTLKYNHVCDAARLAKVQLVVFDRVGSRSHKHAFNISLEGDSRRRPNSGASGAGSGYAATWDQWGVFFSFLFDKDPNMVCGSVSRPTYADAYDFDQKTNGRFAVLNMDGERVPNHGSKGAAYFPVDAHGDHKFEFGGIRYDNAQIFRCTKCTAARIYPL